MLSRRFKRDEESAQTQKTLGQDGFSAPVVGVAPRPWRNEANESAAWQVPVSVQNPAASPAPQRMAQQAAYAMVGRRVIDFADNGDGTLTVARCIDKTADDLDIQFEAGACPVVAIAPHAFEGCTALRRVILPGAQADRRDGLSGLPASDAAGDSRQRAACGHAGVCQVFRP